MPIHTQVCSNRTCHSGLLADRPSMAHDPLSDVEDLRQPGLAVRDAHSSHVRLRDVLVMYTYAAACQLLCFELTVEPGGGCRTERSRVETAA